MQSSILHRLLSAVAPSLRSIADGGRTRPLRQQIVRHPPGLLELRLRIRQLVGRLLVGRGRRLLGPRRAAVLGRARARALARGRRPRHRLARLQRHAQRHHLARPLHHLARRWRARQRLGLHRRRRRRGGLPRTDGRRRHVRRQLERRRPRRGRMLLQHRLWRRRGRRLRPVHRLVMCRREPIAERCPRRHHNWLRYHRGAAARGRG